MTASSIGAMRHRITIEAVTRSGDGGGGATETWTPVADVWAAIEPVTGTETAAAETPRGAITHTVTMRYRAGLAPAMRLRFGARLFEIVALIDPQSRSRRLKCYCRERDL